MSATVNATINHLYHNIIISLWISKDFSSYTFVTRLHKKVSFGRI